MLGSAMGRICRPVRAGIRRAPALAPDDELDVEDVVAGVETAAGGVLRLVAPVLHGLRHAVAEAFEGHGGEDFGAGDLAVRAGFETDDDGADHAVERLALGILD